MRKKFAACLLPFLLPAAARAQEWQPGAGAPAAEAGFRLSEPSGFRTRETFAGLGLSLGKAGPYSFRTSARFAHLAVSDAVSAPAELYRTGAGLSAENGGRSLRLDAGSNSDRPFSGPETVKYDATYTFTVKEKNGHALLGGLNYSSQRSFARNIPLPFLAYRYQSGNFFMLFPFLYRFRFSDRTSLTVTYSPIRNLKASLRYKPSARFYADLEAGGELDQFLLAGRPDRDLRFYYQRYTAAVKPSFALSENLRAACALGYFFKGYYYNGKTFADDEGKTVIGGAPWFGVSLSYSFGDAAPPVRRSAS